MIFSRKMARAAELYRERGTSGFVALLAERLRRATGRLTPQEAAWRDRKISVDAAFDRAAGADTGGVQHLYELSISGPNGRFGVDHIASDPEDFERAIRALEIDPRDFTFVDLGSGKGRAVLMATRLPFKAIVGVEFASELHAIATANVARLLASERSRVTLVLGDASEATPPEGPLVVYMYHPFGPEVMKKVASTLRAAAQTRPIYIVYVNPVHGDVLDDAGWRRKTFGQSYVVFDMAEVR